MRKPNRYNSDLTHSQYGLRNWFRKTGIINQDHQKRLFAMWLEDTGFKCKSKVKWQLEEVKYRFLDSRWQQFVAYMQKNIPLFRELIQESKNNNHE